jgi:hypothetical protein
MSEKEQWKRSCDNCSANPCDSRDRCLVIKCRWDDNYYNVYKDEDKQNNREGSYDIEMIDRILTIVESLESEASTSYCAEKIWLKALKKRI